MAWYLQCFRHYHLGPDAFSSKCIIIYKNTHWLRAVLLKDKYSTLLQYSVIVHFHLIEIWMYRFFNFFKMELFKHLSLCYILSHVCVLTSFFLKVFDLRLQLSKKNHPPFCSQRFISHVIYSPRIKPLKPSQNPSLPPLIQCQTIKEVGNRIVSGDTYICFNS